MKAFFLSKNPEEIKIFPIIHNAEMIKCSFVDVAAWLKGKNVLGPEINKITHPASYTRWPDTLKSLGNIGKQPFFFSETV